MTMTTDTNVGVYEKNRRNTVTAGTRYANCCILFNPRTTSRYSVEQRARREAVEAWEKEWGTIPWDLVQIVTTHVTMQVIVDLRVDARR